MVNSRAACTVVALIASVCGAFAAPISLHPKNPHYFLYRDKPVILITSAEHYGAVINNAFDFRRYLATLQSDGLNYTRLFGGAYIEVPSRSFGILRNTLAPEPSHLVAPWVRTAAGKFDLNQWNPEYFARLRDFVTEAGTRGIIVEFTFFSSIYDDKQWAVDPFNSANNANSLAAIPYKQLQTLSNGGALPFQAHYVRKLVDELASFDNVIFEIQNEPWSDHPHLEKVVNPYLPLPGRDKYPNSIDVADDESLAWQRTVAQWITSEEAKLSRKHLIAQNYCNFFSPAKDVLDSVSVINFHYAFPEAVTLNYGLNKAISYDESGFLGRSDTVYLRQAWNFMLSGGSLFNNLDYSFSPGHEDGQDIEPNGPGGGSPTLRRQLATLAHFLNQFSIESLQPNAKLVQHAAGARARALSDGTGHFGIYFDGILTGVTLNLPPGTYSGSWLNPVTGQTQSLPSFQQTSGTKELVPPKPEDGLALSLQLEK
jgi:hypothetical protein